MKNIHVLPTDKPSRLYLTTKEYIFEKEYSLSTDECQNKNIYITSDENVKDYDKFFESDHEGCGFKKYKIILTTDQDLIKDGVQAIPDEFLEWFVKNPSCEYVEIEKWTDYKLENDKEVLFFNYKIIIPKEVDVLELGQIIPVYAWVGAFDEGVNNYIPCQYELKDIYQGEGCLPNFKTKEECQYWCNNDSPYSIPKEEHKSLMEKLKPLQEQWQRDMLKTLQEPKQELPGINRQTFKIVLDEKWSPKQETLEEAISLEKLLSFYVDIQVGELKVSLYQIITNAYNNGVKCQQERSYSEKEVKNLIKIIEWYDKESDVRPNYTPDIEERIGEISMWDWFEQFKKK